MLRSEAVLARRCVWERNNSVSNVLLGFLVRGIKRSLFKCFVVVVVVVVVVVFFFFVLYGIQHRSEKTKFNRWSSIQSRVTKIKTNQNKVLHYH